jgi:hypothetical protein
LGAKAILEEAHEHQETMAPTIASTMATERGLPWVALGGPGQPGLEDALVVPPLEEAFRTKTVPVLLAGKYRMDLQQTRESLMFNAISAALKANSEVLAIVGYIHLGVLARMFEAEKVEVQAFIFMLPLEVNEDNS